MKGELAQSPDPVNYRALAFRREVRAPVRARRFISPPRKRWETIATAREPRRGGIVYAS